MSTNSISGFQSVAHAKKLAQNKRRYFIRTGSLSFSLYSWWCEKLQLQGFIPAVKSRKGWGQEECSPSDPFARVPCSGVVEVRRQHGDGLSYGHFCLGLLQVLTRNLTTKTHLLPSQLREGSFSLAVWTLLQSLAFPGMWRWPGCQQELGTSAGAARALGLLSAFPVWSRAVTHPGA